jgi:hypothetical protein
VKALLKFLVTAIGLVLILCGVALVLVGVHFDQNLKRGVERSLAFIYQTQVTIEGVQFVPSQAAVELIGLAIQNPEPFQEGTAMYFGSVLSELDLGSVFTSTPAIRRVLVRDAHVRLRYEPGSGTNLGRLADNAARLKERADSNAPPGVRRKFVINELRCESAQLSLSSNLVPVSGLEFALEPFTLTDLKSGSPVATADVCVVFVRSLLREGISVRGIMKPVAEAISRELQRFRGDAGQAPQSTPEKAGSPS